MSDSRILVAIDNSLASTRTVEYMAKLIGPHKGFRLCLVHMLPPLPPGLLEHGGSELPEKEAQLEAELRAQQKRWITAAKKTARVSLKKAYSTLRNAGVPARALQTTFCEPAEGRAAAEDVLQMARESKCGTVVAGRKSVSWFHELFSRDLAEELLRCGKGFSIWVIE